MRPAFSAKVPVPLLCRTLLLGLLAAPALSQTEIQRFAGQAAGDLFGTSVAFVGDVDADGLSDLAIGAPFHDTAGPDAGRVQVFSGRTSQLIRTWDGPQGEFYFGHSLVGAGDVDGDGMDDVLIGASVWPRPTSAVPNLPGHARLISGASGALLRHFAPPANAENFGFALARTSDLDGDGIDDLLIGAPGNVTSGDVGYVYVMSAASGVQLRRDGAANTTNFGFALAVLGDVNADGISDYAAGAPWAANESTGAKGHPGGWVSVHDGANGDELWSTGSGNGYGSQLGWSLAPLGDVDGDGLAELLIGQPAGGGGHFACGFKGHLKLYSWASGAVLRDHLGMNLCGAYGSSAVGLGDLDGDGIEDYAGGEPGWEAGLDRDWPLQVFDGAAGSPIATVASPAPSPSRIGWGFALASGDVNGDGLQDLVVGAPWEDTAANDAGAVLVYTIVRGVRTYCQAQVNSLGCTPMIAGVGTPSASAPGPFLVEAAEVLNQKMGLLIYAYAPKATPFLGGTKCLQAPLQRTPVSSSGGNPTPPGDCSGVLSYDFNARIQAGVDPGLQAGAEVFAQYWSRDPLAASTTNLTDGLAFQVQP